MLSKKEQKYITDVVKDERQSSAIINYLSVHKKEVGFEVFPTNFEGEASKIVFRDLFIECWTPEEFLKHLELFYESVEIDEIADYDEDLSYFSAAQGLSFEGILEDYADELESSSMIEEIDYTSEWESGLNSLLSIYNSITGKHNISCHTFLKWLFNEYNIHFQNDSLMTTCLRFKKYMELCEEKGCSVTLPDDLTVSFNFLMEERGDKCKIVSHLCTTPERKGDNLIYHYDYIPVIDGVPILRWMDVRVSGDEKVYSRPHISCDSDAIEVEDGKDLIIELKLDSRVEVFDGEEWKTDYLGPNRLDVNLSVLRKRRKELGLTQKQVAKAVGVELRTYQKWEKNEKEGVKGVKGISLVRLMHYLGFDLHEVVKDVYNN